MRLVSLLGSTGSIGVNALEIIGKFSDKFVIVGLSAYTNIKKLAIQVARFNPEIVGVRDESCAAELNKRLSHDSVKPKIVFGDTGYIEVAVHGESDIILNAMVGAAGLLPTLAAIDAGKDIALANKETLVMAGKIVMSRVAENKVNLMPVDSEHSAIYQCLLGNNRVDLEEILLTASGGPFLNTPKELFNRITVKDALKHPNWSMGNKITVDSATLMNKALEVLEAKWLFDVPIECIKVLIHPQSIVHSMVSYKDGTVMAQMGVPDMKAAIAYALSFPERMHIGIEKLNFFEMGHLSFQSPDFSRFPCLNLAFTAFKLGGAMPAVMNASNEVAVQAFLDGRIPFTKIYPVIKACMDVYCPNGGESIDVIIRADKWARSITGNIINI